MTNGNQAIRPKRNVAPGIALTVLLIGTLTIAFNAPEAAAQDWWPMFHHDLKHTGHSTSPAPTTGELSWSYATSWIVNSSPAVAEGMLFVGSLGNYVYALNAATGALIWRFPPEGVYGGVDRSSPAVANGKVYIGFHVTEGNEKVYALPQIDPNGDGEMDWSEVVWSYSTGWDVRSSPAVADGMVFIGCMDSSVYALPEVDPNGDGVIDAGEVVWIFKAGHYVDSSPAVADGVVFVGSRDGCVYALPEIDPNGDGVIDAGEVVWRFCRGYGVDSSPAVANGKVYVGSKDAFGPNVYALPQVDPNGDGIISASEVVWSFQAGYFVVSSPAVADGIVFLGSDDGNVYALPEIDPNGDGTIDSSEIVWKFTAGEILRSSPAVADGKVFIQSDDRFYALPVVDPNGDGVIDNTEIIWSYPAGGRSSPAVADGKVYVGSDDWKVYAFGPAPSCQVSPSSMDFGSVTIGSYLDKSFTITNTGGGGLPGSVSESCDHYTIIAGEGAYNLGAAESRIVTVRFSPLTPGEHNCTIETGNALCSDVSCSGLGEEPPVCQVLPANLDFGSVFVGSHLEKNFTITNTGGGTLTGTVSESCGHYDIVAGGGAYSLGASDSVVVTVRFEPASCGQHDCTIETGSDLCDDVYCTGEGESPCQVSPASLNFGTVIVGSYLDRSFTITNIGGGTLNGSVSESCDHYSIVSGGGAYSLGAGDSVIVTVRFEPASVGQHNCTVETGNDLCSDVFCTGVGQSPCQVSPTSLDFGTIMVGSYLDKSFTVTNIGEGSLTGTISESCDHYSIVSGEGVYILASGEYLTVTVRFEPTSVGQHDCIVETGNALCSDVYCTGVGRGEWYWKLPYEDYAPSGMPDIDQNQDGWIKIETDQWTFCGPCAVANCFKWFDSKYNVPPGFPGDGVDMFPLVRDYMDQLAPHSGWDDHDPWNVDHVGTQWNPGVGWPPPTDQPFVTGPQPQPSSMPPWGELVERLAWYFNTDGIQTGYCTHAGTNVLEMQQGIQEWLQREMFDDGTYLTDTLCVAVTARPTFAYVESLVEKSENVILLLGFWYPGAAPVQQQFQEFIRADINENGTVEFADVIPCMQGGPFNCDDAADANDDGVLNMVDCNYITDYLYGGPPPPPPFPNCGFDPTADELDCASFVACAHWWRVGGHYVTAAGVNSIEQKIAVSDPFIDATELGLAEGRVGDGWLIEHFWGSHDPTVHNDEGNVSHDVYTVQESDDPAGRWHLVNYAVSSDPYYWTENFSAQNVPEEFVAATQQWDGVSPIFTEVEYCIHVSPWDYRGDCNGDGEVQAGDIVYLIGYLFRGLPPPEPYLQGDANCDGEVGAGDIVYLINYLFRSWTPPRCCDP